MNLAKHPSHDAPRSLFARAKPAPEDEAVGGVYLALSAQKGPKTREGMSRLVVVLLLSGQESAWHEFFLTSYRAEVNYFLNSIEKRSRQHCHKCLRYIHPT